MIDRIYGFDGDYRWLSNFFVEKNGKTGEHLFQSFKTNDQAEGAAILAAATPGEAKGLGRRCTLRADWEERKEDFMSRVLHFKFFGDPELGAKLLATGDAELIEANTWNDRYWGVDRDTGIGKNRLGVLLMETRDRLREELHV